MKRTLSTTLITLIVGLSIFMATNIYVKNLEKRNQALDTVLLTRNEFFNGQELMPFTNLAVLGGGKENKFLTMDLSQKYDVLITCNFSTHSKWPKKKNLPVKFNSLTIIKEGKDPGLGIRELHRQGITGKGVHVAIIDFPLFKEHVEYKDCLVQYRLTNGKDPANERRTSMHGTAVASLMVGKTCGIAPKASLHYWANVEPGYDYKSAIIAVKEVLEINRKQRIADQIRVLSISLGLNPEIKNYKEWIDTLNMANENGLIVIYCSNGIMGIGCPLGKNRNDPANYRLCYFGQPNEKSIPANKIYIPIDNRTMAYLNGPNEYYFTAKGGLSWAAPYLAGLIALVFQVNPEFKANNLDRLLRETGTPFNHGWIVNPSGLIEKVRQERKNRFTYRILWDWLDHPFATLPLQPDPVQSLLPIPGLEQHVVKS